MATNPSLNKVRWQRNTKGQNAEVLIAGAQAYTTQATPLLFNANAADGEVGMYDATTLALLTTALAANQKYYFMQKRDGYSRTTTTIQFDATKTRRVPYLAPVKQVATITFVDAGYTPVIGDDLEIALIETSPGNEPYPTWAFDSVIGDSYKGTSTPTMAQALINITARINDIFDLVQKDDVLNGQTPFNAVYTAVGGGVYTIVITAGFLEQTFRIAMRGPLLYQGTTVYTTPFVEGSGYYDHVLHLEQEGWIYEGVTTNYPGDGVAPIDFGYPNSYVVNGLTYNIYHLDPLRISPEPMPQGVHNYYAHLYIVVPVPVGGSTGARAASSPDLAIGTVLGYTLTP